MYSQDWAQLLLGEKHTVLGFRAGEEAAYLNREFQDLFYLALFTVSKKRFLLPAWKFRFH